MSPTLVILAAGAGTRYGGLKQLAPVGPCGETLLEYSAFDGLRAGFERVVLVVRPDTEPVFHNRLDDGMAARVPVAYVHQCRSDLPAGIELSPARVKPWGTGQAVLAAESEIDGPFAVVNADDFYGAESYAGLSGFLSESRGRRSLAAIGFHLAETLTEAGPVSRALLEVDDAGRLRKIVEVPEVWRQEGHILCHHEGQRKLLSGDELVSMNMWGFTPELFPELRCRFGDFLNRSDLASEAEFLLPEVIQSLVCEELFRVEVLHGSNEWVGMTFRQDHQRVKATIASLVDQGRYPKELWA